ncbi:MAG: 50S ribosomal protein L31e [Candidatus Micrarchaeota archaeon]
MAKDVDQQTAVSLKQQKTVKKEEKKEEEKTQEGVAGVTPEKAKVEEKKKPEKKEKPKDDEKKKREIVLERVYVVPLSGAYSKPRIKRGNKASSLLREFVSRHMKVDAKNVKIANEISCVLNARGCKKPPKKIAIRVSKDKEGIVEVVLKK